MIGVTGGREDRVDRMVVFVGFLVAVVPGILGGAFESVSAQSGLYALSSLGWVVATATLAIRHAGRGESVVAAGFLVLTIAEALLWVSGRPGDPGYEAGFAGGTMFYVPGLLMVGMPSLYNRLIRGLAVAGAAVWAVGAASFLTGAGFTSTDPLALAGYVLVSSVFIGVGLVTLRGRPGLGQDQATTVSPASPVAAGE